MFAVDFYGLDILVGGNWRLDPDVEVGEDLLQFQQFDLSAALCVLVQQQLREDRMVELLDKRVDVASSAQVLHANELSGAELAFFLLQSSAVVHQPSDAADDVLVDMVIFAQPVDKLVADFSHSLVLEERQSGVNAEEVVVEQTVRKLAELVVSPLAVLGQLVAVEQTKADLHVADDLLL